MPGPPPGGWPPNGGPPFGAQAYGGGFSPPPQPPRRNKGLIAAVVTGVVAVLALGALVVVLAVGGNSGSPDATTAANSSTSAESSTPTSQPESTPDGSGSDGSGTEESLPDDPAELIGIRDAMQKFIDALNTRDVTRIKQAVCSQVRSQVSKAPSNPGNVVLEGLLNVSVDGTTATSQVLTHVELGQQRSQSKQSEETFAKEGSVWYVCPGTEPDIGT